MSSVGGDDYGGITKSSQESRFAGISWEKGGNPAGQKKKGKKKKK